MAENKKSFIMYTDQMALFDNLSELEAGKLIKHIFAYVNDQNPVTNDRIVEMAFIPIKQQLKRDLENWETEILKKGEGGALGNLKRWHLDLYKKVVTKELSLQKAIEESKKRKPSHTDNEASHPIACIPVNDNVNVNVTLIGEWFKDLENSSHLETIARNNGLTLDYVKSQIEPFRKKADLSYPQHQRFINHFKNFVVQLSTKKQEAKISNKNIELL